MGNLQIIKVQSLLATVFLIGWHYYSDLAAVVIAEEVVRGLPFPFAGQSILCISGQLGEIVRVYTVQPEQ